MALFKTAPITNERHIQMQEKAEGEAGCVMWIAIAMIAIGGCYLWGPITLVYIGAILILLIVMFD